MVIQIICIILFLILLLYLFKEYQEKKIVEKFDDEASYIKKVDKACKKKQKEIRKRTSGIIKDQASRINESYDTAEIGEIVAEAKDITICDKKTIREKKDKCTNLRADLKDARDKYKEFLHSIISMDLEEEVRKMLNPSDDEINKFISGKTGDYEKDIAAIQERMRKDKEKEAKLDKEIAFFKKEIDHLEPTCERLKTLGQTNRLEREPTVQSLGNQVNKCVSSEAQYKMFEGPLKDEKRYHVIADRARVPIMTEFAKGFKNQHTQLLKCWANVYRAEKQKGDKNARRNFYNNYKPYEFLTDVPLPEKLTYEQLRLRKVYDKHDLNPDNIKDDTEIHYDSSGINFCQRHVHRSEKHHTCMNERMTGDDKGDCGRWRKSIDMYKKDARTAEIFGKKYPKPCAKLDELHFWKMFDKAKERLE